MSAPTRTPWLLAVTLLAIPAGSLIWLSVRHSPSPVAALPEARGTASAAPKPSAAPVPSEEAPVDLATPERAAARSKVEEARSLARTAPKRRRTLLREALALDPKYEPALEALSLAMLHDEAHDQARELSARCLAVAPDNETCRMVSSYALPAGPDADAVARRAEECLTADPRDARCLATTIGYDVSKGKLDEASRALATLEGVAPEAKQTLFARARVAGAEGRYHDARHDLEEACRQGLEQACFRAEGLRREGF